MRATIPNDPQFHALAPIQLVREGASLVAIFGEDDPDSGLSQVQTRENAGAGLLVRLIGQERVSIHDPARCYEIRHSSSRP